MTPPSIFLSRGLLLDLFVFVLNLFAMRHLSGLFLSTVREASLGDPQASAVLFWMALAMFLLAPLGAVLKRWHFWKGRKTAEGHDDLSCCLFNPIFYFCLIAVVFAVVNAYLLQTIYRGRDPGDAVGWSVLLGLPLIIFHTVLVYRYFSRPKRPPRPAFLQSRASSFLGDVCLFANMVLFQLVWNVLSYATVSPPSGIEEFVGRVFLLIFLALLLYFPPRMFYLTEDIGKGRTWLMILLANSPVFARFLFGYGWAAPW
ncbi:MAG TPA: hypothetical protein VM328_07480 [Fimbriimonadaceae bacterium]|nr:hypothetical protein [Fimbriimonadaceae bacterium]